VRQPRWDRAVSDVVCSRRVSWLWGASRSAEARTSTAWGPSEPGTKPTGLKALRELLHRLDAADFEPLGDPNGVGVSLDKGDEVTDKFR